MLQKQWLRALKRRVNFDKFCHHAHHALHLSYLVGVSASTTKVYGRVAAGLAVFVVIIWIREWNADRHHDTWHHSELEE